MNLMNENNLLNLRGVESWICSQENLNCLNDILRVVFHVFTVHVSMDSLGVENFSFHELALGSLFLVSNRVGGSETGAASFFSDVGLSVFQVSEARESTRTDEKTFAIEGELLVHQSAQDGNDLSLALFLDSGRGTSSSSFFGRRGNLESFSEKKIELELPSLGTHKYDIPYFQVP
jgi:hypothetical protein